MSARHAVMRVLGAGALWFVTGAGFAGFAAPAQIWFETGEVRLNEVPMRDPQASSAAMIGPGDFIVVWSQPVEARGQDATEWIRARRLGSGVPVGGEFVVHEPTTLRQLEPEVATSADGGFLVVWSNRQVTGRPDTKGRLYDSDADPLGAEFLIEDWLGVRFIDRALTSHPAGGFVVTFQYFRYGYELFSRRLDAHGQAVGTDFMVGTPSVYPRREPGASAFRASGDGVAVWHESLGDLPGRVLARPLDADAAPRGPLQRVPSAEEVGFDPAIALDETGGLVVWQSRWRDDTRYLYGVRARHVDDDGAPIGMAFDMNSYTTATHRSPELCAASDGRFVVAWTGDGIWSAPYTPDGDGAGVLARLYGRGEGVVGRELLVNSYTTGDQRIGALSGPCDGTALVSWSGPDPDDAQNDYAVFARTLRVVPAIFDDGLEGGDATLWAAEVP